MRPRSRRNWLTRIPAPSAIPLTILVGTLAMLLGLASLGEPSSLFERWRATPELVFGAGEYGRAWGTLFLHGDLGHLLSNLFLFIPLSYLLFAYFGPAFWLAGLGAAGLVNLAVLKTMPPGVALIGISGMVYSMGAAWLTFFLLLDRREPWRRRFGNALFLGLILFVPETLKPEVSHLSHFLGFVAGVGVAGVYLAARWRTLRRAEYEGAADSFPGERSAETDADSERYEPLYLWELDREWEEGCSSPRPSAATPRPCAVGE